MPNTEAETRKEIIDKQLAIAGKGEYIRTWAVAGYLECGVARMRHSNNAFCFCPAGQPYRSKANRI